MKSYKNSDTKDHKNESDSEESTKSSIDLNEEVYPLTHYIDNRTELLNQVFTVIKKKQLKSMLPTVLKNISLDEIKSLCLEQLLGMSKKRILAVLDDKKMETSSSESDHEEPRAAEDQDTLEIGINPKEMDDILEEKDNPGSKGYQGKNLLDILELEMRARAIRALLKQQEQMTVDKKVNIKMNNVEESRTIHVKRKWDSDASSINLYKNKEKVDVESKEKITNEKKRIKNNNIENVVRTSKVFGKIRRKMIITSKTNKLITSKICTKTTIDNSSIK